MSGLVGMSDYLTLKRLILWGNVSAFSVTLLGKVALRFKRISRKSFWRGPRGRPRALTSVLRPLPTCFAHVEKLGNMVSLHGKNSPRKCATQSACAVETHEIRRSYCLLAPQHAQSDSQRKRPGENRRTCYGTLGRTANTRIAAKIRSAKPTTAGRIHRRPDASIPVSNISSAGAVKLVSARL
jgi:hypothetical protein